jgi:hypothetical protein
MQRVKRIVVVVAGAALLVTGALVGGPDLNDSYNDDRGDFVAIGADPGGAAIYKVAANNGQRVGAIGVGGDGIDQDDLVAAAAAIRPNGDGSDHSWSVVWTTREQFPPDVTSQSGGPLFGVQFS